jgi:hypothetical protein
VFGTPKSIVGIDASEKRDLNANNTIRYKFTSFSCT